MGPVDIELFEAPASHFRTVAMVAAAQENGRDWFNYLPRSDGSVYLRWAGLFEFLIAPDGRSVAGRELGEPSLDSFQTYLLGQVLSFALLRQGREPLHATAVVVDGGAVGFLGDCGFGKSTLGAAFLGAGYPLLTDDLLVLQENDQGGYGAWSGPPRIKLFPGVADALLAGGSRSGPMNPDTTKLIIGLGKADAVPASTAVPLTALYILAPFHEADPAGDPLITGLSPRDACIELIRNTFNTLAVDPARLSSQFELTARVAAAVPVRSLSYPHLLARLPEVPQAVLADLAALPARSGT